MLRYNEEQGEFESVLRRNVQSLEDPDRMIRRRVLDNIRSVLLEDEKGSRPPLSHSPKKVVIHFEQQVQQPILKIVEYDPAEKCRESALDILHAVVLLAQPMEHSVLSTVTLAFLPLAQRRIDATPFPEGSEENRLRILQIVRALMRTQVGWSAILESKSALYPGLMAVLARELADSYPDIKCEVCYCIGLAAQFSQKELRLNQGRLLSPLLGNLGHQRSKVRQASLQALGELLSMGHDAMAHLLIENVLPQFEKLIFDRTSIIRGELLGLISSWLRQGVEPKNDGEGERSAFLSNQFHFEQCETELFFVLLMGLSDDDPDVKNMCRHTIDLVARDWLRRQVVKRAVHTDRTPLEDGEYISDLQSMEICPANAMVRGLLRSLMPKVLGNSGHWTLRMRHRSVLLLADVIRHAQSAVIPFLPSIIQRLASALIDEEAEIEAAIAECARSLGENVAASVVVHKTLPIMQGATGFEIDHRFAGLRLLHFILIGIAASRRGVGAECSRACAEEQVELSSEDVESVFLCVYNEDFYSGEWIKRAVVASQSAKIISSMVKIAPNACASINCQSCLMLAILHVLAFSSESDRLVHEHHGQIVAYLASKSSEAGSDDGSEDKESVWLDHFESLLGKVTADAVNWEKDSIGRFLFDALVRECPHGTALHWECVISIITPHLTGTGSKLDETKLAQLKLAHLFMLEVVIENSLPIALKIKGDHVAERRLHDFYKNVLLPSIKWHAGRTAATVRKVALACQYRLLQNKTTTKRMRSACILDIALQSMRLLQTNLEDYDATSRQLAASCLDKILGICGTIDGVFHSSSSVSSTLRHLLPDLMKCLDDTSADVRQTTFRVLETLFSLPGISSVFPSAVLKDTVELLLVHLDEQECAYGLINIILNRISKLDFEIEKILIEHGVGLQPINT
ncbi:heat repeat containing 2 [Nannochloropsis gaditana]|uniref:Heat repeat containing 2 n=2 Tax=Nannochloropsis gaditana TaxID=72520 RepID=W7TDN1_9STRA|nr:heat repeat containing 2 [Nannochloropsis gaditana]